MKKVFLAAAIVFGAAAFAQNDFSYKVKFEGVHDAAKAAPIINSLKMVFKTPAAFNESTETVEFNSKMSISQTVFNNLMSGEGYQVESFERRELVQAVAPEVKKVPADTNAKTASAAVVKKDTKPTAVSKTPVKPAAK